MPQPILEEPHFRSRLKTLDAFRGIAILSVLLFHYTYRWGPLFGEGKDLYGFRHNVAWFAQGGYGVEFFFIISGFVIFMTLERCRGLADFAVRRFARLYPTYWACMLATFFVTRWFGVAEFSRQPVELLAGVTMLSQEFHIEWVDGAYWSLMVELTFYLWVSLIFFAARGGFLYAWLGFCVAAPLVAQFGHDIFATRYLCYFTAGMGFYAVHARRPYAYSTALFAAAFVLYLVFFRGQTAGEHLLVACMVGLFALFVGGRLQWMGRGPLAYIGLVSYPLYLLHQDIGVSLIGRFDRIAWLNGGPAVAAAAAILFAAAAATHYAVELPSQKLVRDMLERLFPARLARPA